MKRRDLRDGLWICLMVILIHSQTLAFKPALHQPMTHHDITRTALFNTTLNVCKFLALQTGRDFAMPSVMTAESVASACSSADSTKSFKESIEKINHNNAWVDFWKVFSAKHHFDDESFSSGRALITSGVLAVKASVRKQRYEAAREELGKVLHTLQDFYSHSNWIELGKRTPYSNLIRPDSMIENIADSATCQSCNGNDCSGNILAEVIKKQKLTSGYFSPFSPSKPRGKCSHGGFGDLTSLLGTPTGGINKDATSSSHGHLHQTAASVAVAATSELLEDIRGAVGDKEFLRLMGLTQNLVLCFVIDTTGSMSDDIDAVKKVTASIIDSRTSSGAPPSEYILVPFNDPDFGPLIRTTDATEFKRHLSALTANGGGDFPEMCLSGLQLALTGSPPKTEIFVFTDATAKDIGLKSTVNALIKRTQSTVNFMLTNALARRRRAANDQQQFRSRSISASNQDYQDLAQISGGQAIEVTKATLPQATSIIVDSSRSSVVTLFNAVRDPPKSENFTVLVDSSLQNLTIYITGRSLTYTITSPSGLSQSNGNLNGSLGIIEIVGNFHTIRSQISDPTGLWLFSIDSTQPYTLKVVGQSGTDFLFDFIELSEGPHSSYTVLNSKPASGGNITLLLSVLGGDSVKLTQVDLVEAASTNTYMGILEEVTSGQYLVRIGSVPKKEFTVRVTGASDSSRASSGQFQRQSTIQFDASGVSITAQNDGTMEPGKPFTLPFTISTNSSGGDFSIKVTNDRNIKVEYPTSVTLETGGNANGTINLTAPATTPSGTDVTVTIQVDAPKGSDSNYAVLRLAVVAPVTDFSGPVCQVIDVNANCSANCSLYSWNLSANFSDGNGTGIQAVRLSQGNGNFSITTVLGDDSVNVTLVDYEASCCYTEVELVAVDAVGNVGTCFKSIKKTTPTNHADSVLIQQISLWLNLGVLIFYQFM